MCVMPFVPLPLIQVYFFCSICVRELNAHFELNNYMFFFSFFIIREVLCWVEKGAVASFVIIPVAGKWQKVFSFFFFLAALSTAAEFSFRCATFCGKHKIRICADSLAQLFRQLLALFPHSEHKGIKRQ